MRCCTRTVHAVSDFGLHTDVVCGPKYTLGLRQRPSVLDTAIVCGLFDPRWILCVIGDSLPVTEPVTLAFLQPFSRKAYGFPTQHTLKNQVKEP